MNAFMALLTAASVLAHAALGCCIHHAHVPSASLADRAPPQLASGHCCHHDHATEEDGGQPALPRGSCDEGDCFAVAGAAPTSLLRAADAAFTAMPFADLLAIAARLADYVQSAGVQHDLGPPVRPHLFNRVLLI